MPKRNDICFLNAVCEGAMEGLNSGAKYFMRVGDNKIQVTRNEIADEEDLLFTVAGWIKAGKFDKDQLNGFRRVSELDITYDFDPRIVWTPAEQEAEEAE